MVDTEGPGVVQHGGLPCLATTPFLLVNHAPLLAPHMAHGEPTPLHPSSRSARGVLLGHWNPMLCVGVQGRLPCFPLCWENVTLGLLGTSFSQEQQRGEMRAALWAADTVQVPESSCD